MTTQDLPAFLTVNELCERCRIGRTFLYQQIKSGALKVTKIGRMTRFREADVRAWLGRITGGAEVPAKEFEDSMHRI